MGEAGTLAQARTISAGGTRVLRSRWLLALPLTVLIGSVASGDAKPTPADADRLQRKILAIAAYGAAQSRDAHLTSISERECNAYFQFHMKEALPAGVTEPSLRILGNGRLAAAAVVDFDAVRATRQSDDWLDPVSLLSGTLPATAEGTLHTKDGVGRFELESATIGGMSVPPSVLQQVVAYYSRSEEYPRGFALDTPFQLPSSIREIRLGKGEAVVVQ
jgi:hypothetical protein